MKNAGVSLPVITFNLDDKDESVAHTEVVPKASQVTPAGPENDTQALIDANLKMEDDRKFVMSLCRDLREAVSGSAPRTAVYSGSILPRPNFTSGRNSPPTMASAMTTAMPSPATGWAGSGSAISTMVSASLTASNGRTTK